MAWFGPPSILAECPRWDDATSTLTWVDIDGGTLHTATLEHDQWHWRTTDAGVPLAGAVRWTAAPDAYILAIGTSLHARRPDRPDITLHVEHGTQTPLRLNEFVTDPAGRLWAGSMAYDWTPDAGSIYRIDPDGTVTRHMRDVTIANGIGWSPDAETMYTTDTFAGQITAWNYNPETGEPSKPRLFAEYGGTGRPDGMAIDTDGNIWSAIASGGYIACHSSEGTELHREPIPVPVPTSCSFAGPSRDRLIVTTSRKRLDPQTLATYPQSGRTWDTGPIGATGLPQIPFTGMLER